MRKPAKKRTVVGAKKARTATATGRAGRENRRRRRSEEDPEIAVDAQIGGLEVIDIDTEAEPEGSAATSLGDTGPGEDAGPMPAIDPVGSERAETSASISADTVEAGSEDTDQSVSDEDDAETETAPPRVETTDDPEQETAPEQTSDRDPGDVFLSPVAEQLAEENAVELPDASVEEQAPTDGEAPAPEGPPRSIAESAGLDDEERITEELPASSAKATGESTSETAEEPREATSTPPASDESVADTPTPEEPNPVADSGAPAPDAEVAPVEETAAAEEHGTTETDREAGDEPEVATNDRNLPAEASDEAASDAAVSASTTGEQTGDTASQAEEEPETTAEPASSTEENGDNEDSAGSNRRRRKRRSRKSDRDAEEAKSAPESDNDSPAKDERDDNEDEDVDEVGAEDTLEEAAHARVRLRRKYKIQDVIKVRQILLVQVVKEERGNKGAALTTYLSLAGRYCVLMPNTARGGGISRKITNASDRKRLREITGELDVPQGMGLIVRTAGAERTRPEIKRDYEFLLRQWEQIRDLTLKSIAPALIYEEGSLIKRTIRDIYSKEIDQILVEGETGYREAKEYMKMLMPSHAKNVQQYTDPIPMFTRYQVESYLNGMFNPTVQLKSGGYIVIGVTEALVAIDVNSGRSTKEGSIEETALKTNLEAAEEVARQLRLRDLAGLIVIDFIDMDENRNNRAVEKRMKEKLKTDRARIQVGRISAFGLMEMSRQRLRPGMLEATTQPCSHCQGTGIIRSDDSMSLSILREVEEEGVRGRSSAVQVHAPIQIANYLMNQKREHIGQIEARHGIAVHVLADPSVLSPDFRIEREKGTPRAQVAAAPVVTAESAIDAEEVVEEEDETVTEAREEEDGRRRRRGRRGGRRRRQGEQTESETEVAESAASGEPEDDSDDEDRGRRRRSRGRRRRRNPDGEVAAEQVSDTTAQDDGEAQTTDSRTAVNAEQAAAPTDAEDAPALEQVTTTSEAPEEAETNESASEETEAPDAPEEPADEKTEAAAAVEEVAIVAEATGPALAAAAAAEAAVVEASVETPPADGPPKPKRRGWWSFGI